ncbi:uncharacterized protein LOC127530664 isoform X2 [Acanthochromis polyacanthus]|uniref:uncharacterized protein LOC127530664 isoform X2 n=1 Tax=Acanthochromis polyacanthus TaxID=80966 RepID=UPI0022343A8F|nr:uncharacterized protein LOC127530664 isoform X2 [Acanthochromis polyacanthus]
MTALHDKFGQPHQLALRKIASVLEAADIRRGDGAAFEKFALQVQSLVGMLSTLGPEGETELRCGLHVARLLNKLPPEMRSDFRRTMLRGPGATYTLSEFSEWLKQESWCHDFDMQSPSKDLKQRPPPKMGRSATVLHGAEGGDQYEATAPREKARSRVYCPFCENSEHFLNQCSDLKKLTKDQITDWIRTKRRCWRCGRSHQAAQCDLKKPCGLCKGKHLEVLHEVNVRTLKDPVRDESCPTDATTEVLYLDKPVDCKRVLLKVVRVILHHGDRSLDTYALLDDGSERTMLLPAAIEKLGLHGTPEALALRTIRQDVQTLKGSSVSLSISPASKPKQRFLIKGAFTSGRLGLAEQSYPVSSLKKKCGHLAKLPIQPFE